MVHFISLLSLSQKRNKRRLQRSLCCLCICDPNPSTPVSWNTGAIRHVLMAASTHITTEELLDVVISVVCVVLNSK
jgi:hypothetical protein